MGTDTVKDDRANEALMSYLKRHLMAKGLTGADLARKMNVSPTAVNAWLSGKWLPKPKHCPKIARIIGVDALELTRMMVPERSDSAPGGSHPGETSSK